MSEILIMGHKNPDTDSICSSIVKEIFDKKSGKDNVKAVRLGNANKETEYVLNYLKIDAPELVEKIEDGQEVILVDHNEFGQSVANIENAKIKEVVDHHRVANFQTLEPLFYTAKPYGCTSTILFGEFKSEGYEIDNKTAILMLSAIISDTLLLKSPTCTEKDKEAYSELEKIAGIDAEKYGLEMLKAGTDLSTYSAKEVINLDAKEFEEKGKKFIVSQVNTADIADVFQRKEEISFAMEKEIVEKGLNFFMFVITDIINTNSKIIVLGQDKEIAEKAFGNKLDSDDAMIFEGVVSRKKQIAPPLLANIG